MSLTHALVDQIVDAAQDLHKCGTFEAKPLRALAAQLAKRRITFSAETGSGASTLLFSHSSDQHLAFTIDSGGGSVLNVQASPLLDADHVTWIEGPTQLTLPRYKFQYKLQAVLIDGPHAYPFPDLEYYYLYQQLDSGGLLVIDDIQIPTIRNLFEFLVTDDMFSLDEVVATTAFFTRTGAPLFDPVGDGWWKQRYNNPEQGHTSGVAMCISNMQRSQDTLSAVQLREAVSIKQREIDQLNNTLSTIHNSHGWKVLSAYYALRNKLFPGWR